MFDKLKNQKSSIRSVKKKFLNVLNYYWDSKFSFRDIVSSKFWQYP